jgi:methyl-accepting chemotaxis protein
VQNLKLVTKMSLLIAVLVLTTLSLAGAGYLGFRQVNERADYLTNVTNKDNDICAEMRLQLIYAIRAQKNAVISTKDEDSRKFAEQARVASREVERLRQELVSRRGSDPSMVIRQELEAINRTWAEYQKVEESVLDLAVQNTNTKALALCFGAALAQVNAYETALDAILTQNEKRLGEAKSDAMASARLQRQMRLVESIRVEALRFHVELAAFANASSSDVNQVEQQVAKYQQSRDTYVAELTKTIDEKDQALLDRAMAIRDEYQKSVADIRRLSKIDSNNRAAELSLTQAFVPSDACDKHLKTLKEQLGSEGQTSTELSKEAVQTAGWRMLIVTLVGLPVGLILSFLTVRSVTRPVAQSVAMTKAIAGGDLTTRMKLEQKDEIGELAGAIDAVAEQLSRIMTSLKEKAGQINVSSDELNHVSRQLHTQSEHVANQSGTVASATEELSQSIQSMAAAAEQMSMNLASISSASEEMSVNVGTISSAAEQTSTSVQAVSQAVAGISVSFQDIAKDAQDGSQVANKATQMASTATTAMNSLHQSAVEINKVTETIKMIALQTNLLALNATIEATSAGEAGKGFAVVANEIKELANQSGKAAEGITTKIEGIQVSIRNAVQVINNVAEVIGAINNSAGRISESVEKQTQAARTISLNVKEASKGVGEIARSIAEVASGANDMSKNVGEASQGAGAVSKNASEASKAANEISHSIHEVSTASKETTASAGQVRQSAEALTRIGAGLRDIVSKFKTDGQHA